MSLNQCLSLVVTVTILGSTPPAAGQVNPLHTVHLEGGDPLIVVLHGGPGLRHNYLRPEWDRLLDHGSVLYYDQRGCGLSVMDGPFTWKQHVRDLEALLDEHTVSGDDEVVLTGSSWGAILAVLYAREHPQQVSALVLSGVPSWRQFVEKERERVADMDPRLRELHLNVVAKSEFIPAELLIRDSLWNANQSPEPNRELASRLGDGCLIPQMNTLRSLHDASSLVDLEQLSVPTLILDGDQPDVRESGGADLASALPRATLRVLRGTGHDPWLEDSEAFFDEVASFLEARR